MLFLSLCTQCVPVPFPAAQCTAAHVQYHRISVRTRTGAAAAAAAAAALSDTAVNTWIR